LLICSWFFFSISFYVSSSSSRSVATFLPHRFTFFFIDRFCLLALICCLVLMEVWLGSLVARGEIEGSLCSSYRLAGNKSHRKSLGGIAEEKFVRDRGSQLWLEVIGGHGASMVFLVEGGERLRKWFHFHTLAMHKSSKFIWHPDCSCTEYLITFHSSFSQQMGP